MKHQLEDYQISENITPILCENIMLGKNEGWQSRRKNEKNSKWWQSRRKKEKLQKYTNTSRSL